MVPWPIERSVYVIFASMASTRCSVFESAFADVTTNPNMPMVDQTEVG
jgi:hypothetical protein